MIDSYDRALTLVATTGSGVMAGAFLVFSTFVMTALRRLPAEQGLAAMQAMNAAAPSPVFMSALFGNALACAALGASAATRLGEARAGYQLGGSLLYLVGVVALTAAYHVPRNEALGRVDVNDADAAAAWCRYVPGWVGWNHVRTLAALASTVLLALALRAG